MKCGNITPTSNDTVEQLKDENEELKAELKIKDKEIERLKSRIRYLGPFEPKTKKEFQTIDSSH